jgi:hypothetical protein
VSFWKKERIFFSVALQGMHGRFHLRLEVRVALNGGEPNRIGLEVLELCRKLGDGVKKAA